MRRCHCAGITLVSSRTPAASRKMHFVIADVGET